LPEGLLVSLAQLPELNLAHYLDEEWLAKYSAYLPTARDFWAQPDEKPTDFGVESSTIRAYRTGQRGEEGPLAVFNDWAKEQLAAVGSWPVLDTQERFDAWHAQLNESLAAHWKARVSSIVPDENKKVHEQLSFAHRNKVIDLFVKWLRCAPHAQLHHENVLKFGHCLWTERAFTS
jgi:hypothetical protein